MTPRTFSGFSPRPMPKLIATARTRGPALAISKGIDRDRAVDESGNQLAVFGRRGARPLNRAEMQRLYLHSGNGAFYSVTDESIDQPRSQPDTSTSSATLYFPGFFFRSSPLMALFLFLRLSS